MNSKRKPLVGRFYSLTTKKGHRAHSTSGLTLGRLGTSSAINVVVVRFILSLVICLGIRASGNSLPAQTSELTPEEAREAFTLVAHDGVPRDILEDFCKVRAYFGAQALLRYGVRAAQVEASGDELGIYSLRSLSGERFISWANHTALVVKVLEKSGRTHVMVIDPSLFATVVPEREWLATISRHPGAKITDISYYRPELYTGSLTPSEQLKRLYKYQRELGSGVPSAEVSRQLNQDFLNDLFGKRKIP